MTGFVNSITIVIQKTTVTNKLYPERVFERREEPREQPGHLLLTDANREHLKLEAPIASCGISL